MKRVLAIVVGAFVLANVRTANAVPVVPNFQQGSMTSRTETSSTVTETINSIDMRTGWEYSVTGVGVSNNGEPLNPPVTTSTVNVTPSSSAGATGGAVVTGTVTSSFDSLDFSSSKQLYNNKSRRSVPIHSKSHQGPGMTNQTIIQRVTTVESVTDTTSTFTQ